MKICLWCNKEHNKKGTCCSQSCAVSLGNSKRICSEETKEKHRKRKTLERINVEKICEKCKKSFFVKRTVDTNDEQHINKRETRFCSRHCANGHTVSEETKRKISETIINKRSKEGVYSKNNRRLKYFCLSCGKGMLAKRKYGLCKKCLKGSPEYRKKLSGVIKERVRKGLHKGWQSRVKLSYPEKFFRKVLQNNGLIEECKINFPIKKRDLGINCDANYFLDFFFSEKMIDLEIDGKQHLYEDRKVKDIERDKALEINGYKVYRIKWKSINKEEGKIYIKEEIDKFLEFYKK